MRSKMYPTQYRVGQWRELDVYWHPGQGFAVKRDQSLHAMQPEALDEVTWFDREEDLEVVLDHLDESAGGLMKAMGRDMYERVLDALDDLMFAGQAAREKAQELRRQSGVY